MSTFDAENNKTSFTVGNVSGYVGDEGGEGNDGGSNQKRVWNYYGFHCSGLTCSGSLAPAPATQPNKLWVKLHWVPTDPEKRYRVTINATAEMTNKQSAQKTQDHDCPVGPPTWSAMATLSLSKPAVGVQGGPSGGGNLAQSFAGSNQDWVLPAPNQPAPPGYSDESGAMSTDTWTPDPNNPDSTYRQVTAVATASVANASATEIDVVNCSMQGKCTLTVNWSEEEVE